MRVVRIYSPKLGMKFGIEKMLHANNEIPEMTYDGRNRSTKSRKN